MIIIGLSVIKIITKQQVTVFVVIFLFCFLGFLITDYEIQIRDKAYGCEEKQVEVTGRISKIVKNQSQYRNQSIYAPVSKRFNYFFQKRTLFCD